MSTITCPNVFISSTCTDLKEIRSCLKEFINNDLKYNALLSEENDFPCCPEQNAISNCIDIVNKHADIFVLVIDKKYGYVTSSGKSVTYLEYLTAVAKGIPIYCFLSKDVKSYYEVWKRENRVFDTWQIDNDDIFKFIDDIYNKGKQWVDVFETGAEIKITLQKRLAGLFKESILLKNKTISSSLPYSALSLSGESLRVAIEKPYYWEYLLLGNILISSILSLEKKYKDYKNNIIEFSKINFIKIEQCIKYGQNILSIVERVSEKLPIVLNKVNEAIKSDEDNNNMDEIIYGSEKFIGVYSSFLDIGISINNTIICGNENVTEACNNYIYSLKIFVDSVLEDMNNYVEVKIKPICKYIYDEEYKTNESKYFDCILVLKQPDISIIRKCMEELKEAYLFNNCPAIIKL